MTRGILNSGKGGAPLGSKHRECTPRRRAASSANGSLPRPLKALDDETKRIVNEARKRGALAMPDVIDDLVRMARTGFSRYVGQDGLEMFERVTPETRIFAARFIGDRCGMPPRAETEVSAAEGMPLTVIVMGVDAEQ